MRKSRAILLLFLAWTACLAGCYGQKATVKVPVADEDVSKKAPKEESAKEVSASAPVDRGWSHWRGPEQIGVSRDRDLPEKFSLNPKAPESNLIWKVPYGGRSTPIVQHGRVYVINKCGEGVEEQERVMCFDEKDGKVLWEHKFNVFLTDIVSVRLGWTTPVGDPETGYVYTHGTQGLLFCFDKDGKIVWQHSMTEEYGRISGYGGRVTSPIVDGNLLIISMLNASWGYQGMGRTRFVAFDKRTGKVVWWASTGFAPKDTYYSTPVVANIGGERLLISGGGDGGVHAFKVRTGEKVWSYIFGTAAVNCSPVVHDNFVFIGHGEDNEGIIEQGRVICVDGSKVDRGQPKLVWKVDGIKAKFASPIIHEGRLYVCDEVGKLFCLNAKDGTMIWDFLYGRNTKGSPVWADGKIYIPEVNSKFHILKPGAESCERLYAQFFRKTAGGSDVEINGSPAVCHGKVFFMTSNELLCIGKKDHTAKPDPIPKKPGETPLVKDAEPAPAHLQIVPADVVLYPGDSVDLKVRSFNSHGQLLGEARADFELAPMRSPEGLPAPPKGGAPPPKPPELKGELSEKNGSATKLTAAKLPPVQFGRVVAKQGDLTAECRVRVVARLPYAANFAPVPVGRTPAGWVNCQGKFSVQEEGGKKVLKKRNDNASPLVARANAFMGLPNLKDYTIEADLMGTKVGDDMPDQGIVCQRYTLMLAGNQQKLRLVSWDALPRIDESIAFPWKPETWYRLKLTVEIKDGKGTVKGKCWPRGEKEPENWTVTVVDPIPNTEGAPAVYGYVGGILGDRPGNTIYYDNVKVTPNGK